MSEPQGPATRPWWVVVVPAVLALVALVAVLVVALRGGEPSDEPTSPAPEVTGAGTDPEPVAVSSSSPRYGSLEHLVAASQLIVQAEVVSAAEGRLFGDPSDQGGQIMSRLVTLRIDRVLLGTAPDTDEILLEEEGWTADGAPVVVDGLSMEDVGDRGFWFLVPGGDPEVGAYLLVNFQGRYLIRGDTLQGAEVTQADEPVGYSLVSELSAMTPDELAAAVEAAG